jgi:beta-lactamase class A
VAGLLAYGATAQLSPGAQLASVVLASAIAFAAHGGKTAIRAAVTPSPEPLSNIGLSLTEDALAIGLVWFATQHPYAAAVIVGILLVLLVVVVRMISKSLRALFRGARTQWQKLQLEWLGGD